MENIFKREILKGKSYEKNFLFANYLVFRGLSYIFAKKLHKG